MRLRAGCALHFDVTIIPMRFSDHFLNDIRERIPISEIVGRRVNFDRRKSNTSRGDYWGCCPFHGEKTPSFHCEDQKGRYHCFGCGVSGDHFRFLMELDGLQFTEAVERLAGEAGLPMPSADPAMAKREKEKAGLHEVMAMAAGFFREQLQEADGARARAYLRDRGMRAEIQQTFGIGYAPNSRNALKQFLVAKGVDAEQMIACGLLIAGDDIAVPYDRFRGRIMFPIENPRGQIVAFGGRALSPDVPAKYLNSPETEIFSKGNLLYNFARARVAAQEKGQLIVAEGYMDVIALHGAGFDNAVAPMGTALTENQLALCWRVVDEPTICFDGDRAGETAANRTVDIALGQLKAGKSVKFVLLKNGMDPDDVLRDQGPPQFQEYLNNAAPLHELVMTRRLHEMIAETPEQQARVEHQIMADIKLIRDPAVFKYYAAHARLRLFEHFKRYGKSEDRGLRKSSSLKIEDKSVAKILLGFCVEYPGIIPEYVEEISNIRFKKDPYNFFVQEMYKLYVEYADLDVSMIYNQIDRRCLFVIESIHGSEKHGEIKVESGNSVLEWSLARGHRLKRLFPALNYEPPEETIKLTFRLLLDKVELINMEEELNFDQQTSDAEIDVNAIVCLKKAVLEKELEILAFERELDEQFQSLKSHSRARKLTLRRAA